MVTLHIVILEQGGDDNPFGVTGVNEFCISKVNPHMIHLLVLERHEEDEVPRSQLGAGDQVAAAGLVLGAARKGYPRHCQIHLCSQTGTVYAASIHAAFAIFYPDPAIGLSFPGAREYCSARRDDRFLGFTAGSDWSRWWMGRGRALATNEQEGGKES